MSTIGQPHFTPEAIGERAACLSAVARMLAGLRQLLEIKEARERIRRRDPLDYDGPLNDGRFRPALAALPLGVGCSALGVGRSPLP